MAAGTSAFVWQVTDNTRIRNITNFIFNAMIAGGFVQTTDTGQLNPATATPPGTNNTDAGYLMFRSDDATGGLHNFYVKFRIGRGSNADNPRVIVQAGWGSDGSGTLTGNLSGEADLVMIASVASGTPDHNYSIDGLAEGRMLFMFLWSEISGSAQRPGWFGVERVRNPDGTFSDSLFVFAGTTSAIYLNRVVPYSGTVSTNTTSAGMGWRNIEAGIASYGGNKGVGSLAPIAGGALMESANFFSGNNTDFTTAQQQYSFNVYGSNHTYILCGLTGGAGSGYKLLGRYD